MSNDEVLQRNLYYPFGLALEGAWRNEADTQMAYLYNGKELNEELGLNWQSFGFREYDAAIGRFPSVDPIADNFAHVSPFNYAENEPVGHIDLWGLQKATLNNGDIVDGPVTQNYIDKRNSYNFANNDFFGTELPEVEVVASSLEKNKVKSSPTILPHGAAESGVIGSGVGILGHGFYSKELGAWTGLNGKSYSLAPSAGKTRPFYGNGTTGGVNLAKNKATNLGRTGNLLGAYSVYATRKEFKYNMSQNPGPNLKAYLEMVYGQDQIVNGSGFLGLKGAAFGLGYNAGYMIEFMCNCNIQYNGITKDFTPIEETLTEYDNLGINLFGN